MIRFFRMIIDKAEYRELKKGKYYGSTGTFGNKSIIV